MRKLLFNSHILSRSIGLTVSAIVLSFSLLIPSVSANAPLPQDPQSGSVGVEATLNAPAPTVGATISTPTTGQSFSTEPVTVAGICPTGLLVKIFANNVFVGSAECINGSYSLQANLFDGTNNLVARVYDALDQPGPDSNSPNVTLASSQFTSFGSLLALTSNYAKRGADPGQQLTWPIVISGGTEPYALSVDWGDSTQPEVLSESSSGTVNITHTYQTAGTYAVIIQATDKNGETAFLQLVGVATGVVGQSNNTTGTGSSGTGNKVTTKVLWWPSAVFIPLLLVTFWIGMRYEIFVLRKRLGQSNDRS
jgi:hypothetical protein